LAQCFVEDSPGKDNTSRLALDCLDKFCSFGLVLGYELQDSGEILFFLSIDRGDRVAAETDAKELSSIIINGNSFQRFFPDFIGTPFSVATGESRIN
jgi:hypothetical protein